jgi:tetratricopeptide (TPR) repeat protein
MAERKRAAIAVASLALLATPAAAQIPDEFTNLRFFPEDISQRELVGNMRSFSFALDVRCTYCHVGEEGQPFSTYDFASDDKATKRKARVMLEMVRTINEEHLTQLPDRGEPNLKVSCSTCHGGLNRPQTIGSAVGRVARAEGGEAAVARYRELREEYYGSRAYDFGEQPLVELGSALGREERLAEARAMFELTLEFVPRSFQAALGLGQVAEALEDSEAAIVAYRLALEIVPGHAGAQRRLAALTGGS